MTAESDWCDHLPFPGPRAFHRSVSHGQRLYVIGGYRAMDGVPEMYRDVQTCTLRPDGSLGDWSETTPLPEPRAGHGCVVHGNRIYIVGGWRDRAFLGDTLIGTIAPDGTIERWEKSPHTLHVPRSNLGLATCSLPNGRSFVYAVGGAAPHSEEARHLADVEYAAIEEDGQLGEWHLSPYTLAGCRAGVAAVIVGDRLYAIGGWGDWEIYDDAQYTQIGEDGAIGYWYKGGFTLPLRTAGHAALALGGQDGDLIVAMGGQPAVGHYSGFMQLAHLPPGQWPRGSTGPWTFGYPPLAEGLSGHTLAYAHSRLFVLGGMSRRNRFHNTVRSARFLPEDFANAGIRSA